MTKCKRAITVIVLLLAVAGVGSIGTHLYDQVSTQSMRKDRARALASEIRAAVSGFNREVAAGDSMSGTPDAVAHYQKARTYLETSTRLQFELLGVGYRLDENDNPEPIPSLTQ
jgi:hypothetical protein